jgi:alkaline phosphatase D
MSGLARREVLVAGAAALAGCASADTPDAVRVRIGVASCADQDKPQPVWDAALAERPDFFVFAGDNVYASEQPFDIERLRQAYDALERHANFERLRAAVPQLAIWDDHDYGLNDGGAAFAHKQASKDELLRFWRVGADDPRRTREGLYHAQTIERAGGRVQVIALDTRWFRSPLKITDQRGAPGKERYLPDADPAKTLLGEAQWRWLEARLRESADVRVIVSSIQCVVEGHGWERWGNLPAERERLYRLIRDTGARGVVVVSGDRHIGAIYRQQGGALPYPLHEMTSSGVTHPWASAKEDGPNRLGPLVTVQHYGVVDIDFAARRLALSLRGTTNQVLLEHRIAFDQLGIP